MIVEVRVAPSYETKFDRVVVDRKPITIGKSFRLKKESKGRKGGRSETLVVNSKLIYVFVQRASWRATCSAPWRWARRTPWRRARALPPAAAPPARAHPPPPPSPRRSTTTTAKVTRSTCHTSLLSRSPRRLPIRRVWSFKSCLGRHLFATQIIVPNLFVLCVPVTWATQEQPPPKNQQLNLCLTILEKSK